ncbi:hypothetical protein CERSUDRAFT_125386 [Gelatoporia subvermispora B]|uniref:Uncharacterized protein n=1 Tax=Ceriporiopsis subvermispora (strain B) TaxID=914234 RepID=M2R847_CERS8|nr:hypothetical protein CERSUDRAFT_125386 [Gelatoporia subvermispora B]
MPRPSTAKPPTSPPRWTFRRILNQWGLGGLINKSASGVSVTALKTIGWNILSTRILVSPTGNIAHELVVRRIYSIQLDYFVPFGAAAGKPIPVPAHWKQPNEILGAAAQDLRDGGEASIEDDNALQNMTLEYIKGALNLIHKLSGDKRIVFREANHNSEDDDNAYEPRMFVRSSSSIQQQSAIINLMNLLRLPDDLHTGELLVDRSLGAAIQAYFDEAAHEGTPYRYVIYS